MTNEEIIKIVMCSEVSEKMFNLMLEQKKEDLKVILDKCSITKQQLVDALCEECFITGMENRICNTAIDFLITKYETESISCKASELHQDIRDSILMAGIYYTNVAPDAIKA